jgi:hypothetical protein
MFGRFLVYGRLIAASLAALLSVPAAAGDSLVRAVIDHERAVIACVVGNVVKNARDCTLGDAVISEFVDMRPGTFDFVEYEGKLKIGLPRGLEGATLAACGVVIADDTVPSTSVKRTGQVALKPLDPQDKALTSEVADALYLRSVRLQKAFQITAGGETRLYFLASNRDEALQYAEPHWPLGDQINYYILAGFLKTNRDGRHVVDVAFSDFDTALTDAGPFFDMLGMILIDGKLRLVTSRGILLAHQKFLTDLNWDTLAEQPALCQ